MAVRVRPTAAVANVVQKARAPCAELLLAAFDAAAAPRGAAVVVVAAAVAAAVAVAVAVATAWLPARARRGCLRPFWRPPWAS